MTKDTLKLKTEHHPKYLLRSWEVKIFGLIAICGEQGNSECFLYYKDGNYGTKFRTKGVDWVVNYRRFHFSNFKNSLIKKYPDEGEIILEAISQNPFARNDFIDIKLDDSNILETENYQKSLCLFMLLTNPSLSYALAQSKRFNSIIIPPLPLKGEPTDTDPIATAMFYSGDILFDVNKAQNQTTHADDPFLILYEEMYHVLDFNEEVQDFRCESICSEYVLSAGKAIKELKKEFYIILNGEKAFDMDKLEGQLLGKLITKFKKISSQFTYQDITRNINRLYEYLLGAFTFNYEKDVNIGLIKSESFARLLASIDCFADIMFGKISDVIELYQLFENYLDIIGIKPKDGLKSPFDVALKFRVDIYDNFLKDNKDSPADYKELALKFYEDTTRSKKAIVDFYGDLYDFGKIG